MLEANGIAFSSESLEILGIQERDLLSSQTLIEESHRRCRKYGVDPGQTRLEQRLPADVLRQTMQNYAALSSYARILFSDLHQSIQTPDTLFVLTSLSGHIVSLYSSPQMRERASRYCGLEPGVALTEESSGTTALSISLHQRRPAALRADQHYCSLFHQCYSVAALVDGRDGVSSAGVALFSHVEGRLGEKIALVRCIARELSRFCQESFASAGAAWSVPAMPAPAQLGENVKLTNRQKRVLLLFAEGRSYKQIARDLGVASVKTVEEHLDAVRNKFSVSTRRQCIHRAAELGLLGACRFSDQA